MSVFHPVYITQAYDQVDILARRKKVEEFPSKAYTSESHVADKSKIYTFYISIDMTRITLDKYTFPVHPEQKISPWNWKAARFLRSFVFMLLLIFVIRFSECCS